ncbi:MAG: serine/threonine protein kinase [Deltaproteobacteria bacterium]|nr:serine/threonine protein kinase [Deltaproteobacteria bacterium]
MSDRTDKPQSDPGPGPAAAPEAPRGGVPFGRYTLLRKIATGGMAQLYLATMAGEADFKKMCVVKKILPHLGEQEHFVNMFLDEARIAATLNHPNIVQIYDLGKVGGAYFIAMEYVAGEDLARIAKRALQESCELPLELCCRIGADLCAGLHYAHEQRDIEGRPLNIVHRDVSPQNILVTFDGQVKIVDFGIAKAANKAAHTRTGTIMGKTSYMSPEQCLGGDLDRRSDIFAVGILLFELITRSRLFKRENELLTMRTITEEDAPRVSARRPGVPAALEEIVGRALQRERERRFASALEMREALEHFIADFGLPASGLEVGELMHSLFPDHADRQSRMREAISISEVIRALPSTGVKDLGTPSAPVTLTETASSRRRRRVGRGIGVGAALAVAAAAALAIALWPRTSGQLVLSSVPAGAQVLLDHTARGATPLALNDLRLDHAYLLEVSASGFAPHRENLYLTADRPSREVRLVLEPVAPAAIGTIVVATDPPGAGVLLDGNDTGLRTPARLEGVPSDVEHSVGVTLAGYAGETRRVLLRPGAEQRVDLALTRKAARAPTSGGVVGPAPKRPSDRPPQVAPPVGKARGLLSLRTKPWTTVYHGSVELGPTPLFKQELPVGPVTLRLVNREKGIDQTITVEIKEQGVTVVDKTLP